MYLPVDLPDGRSTTSYTLHDATRSIHVGVTVFRKSTEKLRGLARVLLRRLPSIFVALAAFIDGKSVPDSRSKISAERPEERCHLSCRHCRRFTWHMEKLLRRRKLDRQISRGCLARC